MLAEWGQQKKKKACQCQAVGEVDMRRMSSLLHALPTFSSTGPEGVREQASAGAVFIGALSLRWCGEMSARRKDDLEKGLRKWSHTIGASLDIRHKIIAGQQIWHNQIAPEVIPGHARSCRRLHSTVRNMFLINLV